ncbi:hypothetical protein QBC44DRAFT_391680 [Cladorrhinum sp. PSN332]|nr:hypothetical protein QBC44DRAFT_391680 [Cladorrhinum sp. PSN332]
MRTLLLSALLAAVPFGQGTPLSTPRNAGIVYATQAPTESFTDYLYLYFTGERIPNGEQVYGALSNNNSPKSWTTLNSGQPILASHLGMKGIRDPSLIISPDRSKFFLIATDLKVYGLGWGNGTCFTCPETGSKQLIPWTSTDLVNWTGPVARTVSPPEAGMTWAPDAIWDPARNKYMVFWTSKLQGNLIILRCWTEDFETFAKTEVFGEFGMDLTIAEDKGKFYMISKRQVAFMDRRLHARRRRIPGVRDQ